MLAASDSVSNKVDATAGEEDVALEVDMVAEEVGVAEVVAPTTGTVLVLVTSADVLVVA